MEGAPLVSEIDVTQQMPSAPSFTPRNGTVVDKTHTVVRWDAPGTGTPEPGGMSTAELLWAVREVAVQLEVVGADMVEVIIEQDELGHSFDVIVSGSTTRLTVPPQFLRRGREYKIEVQSVAANGNRTIAESTFRTE